MTTESLDLKTCPRCQNTSTELTAVAAGMRTILQQNGINEQIPAAICSTCYNQLTNSVSQGVKLRIEQQTREKNRHLMWKGRVNLIRQARQMMQTKSYSEAAIAYEKYIRVLEISYDLKPGQLRPDVFGKSSRSKELTVIATTYWDLLRIYDTHPQYRNRMVVTAKKLAEFIPFSPIFPDVVKKAQVWLMTARNPDVVKDFLRLSKAGTGRCFIATSAFEDPFHETVISLRNFRDSHLQKNAVGRYAIVHYYRHAPKIALWLDRHPAVKPLVRKVLTQLAMLLSK